MGTIAERKAIEKMSQSWRRLTGGALTASTLPAREGGEEGAREGAAPSSPAAAPPGKKPG